MYVMHNSEYPLSCFALFENGPCLIADANFDVLMVKLKGFFQNAKGNKIESRGTRYQYCDFLVKVGTVTMGPSARGISVEVRMTLNKRKNQIYHLNECGLSSDQGLGGLFRICYFLNIVYLVHCYELSGLGCYHHAAIITT